MQPLAGARGSRGRTRDATGEAEQRADDGVESAVALTVPLVDVNLLAVRDVGEAHVDLVGNSVLRRDIHGPRIVTREDAAQLDNVEARARGRRRRRVRDDAPCAAAVSCWGDDTLGQLGDGRVLSSPAPLTLLFP
jgi:hypothetical protein